MTKSCSLVVIGKNRQIVINNDLLGLSFDTNVKPVCSNGTELELLIKSLVNDCWYLAQSSK